MKIWVILIWINYRNGKSLWNPDRWSELNVFIINGTVKTAPYGRVNIKTA